MILSDSESRAVILYKISDASQLLGEFDKAYDLYIQRHDILSRSETLQLQRDTARQQQLALDLQQVQVAQQAKLLEKMGVALPTDSSDSGNGDTLSATPISEEKAGSNGSH